MTKKTRQKYFNKLLKIDENVPSYFETKSMLTC